MIPVNLGISSCHLHRLLVVVVVVVECELYNDDETWLPHSGCTPVALPCLLVTHKARPAAINIARAV